MKEQLLYFYQRNNRPFYIIKVKGKTDSLFAGNSVDLLSSDFDMLQSGEYVCMVANNEKGFAGCPEFDFSVSKISTLSVQNRTTQNNLSFEEAVKQAYEKGINDYKEKQIREEKEAVLLWLIDNKTHIEKLIQDLTDDDDSNDSAAKTSFMDVIGEIPDAVSSLETMMQLGKSL